MDLKFYIREAFHGARCLWIRSICMGILITVLQLALFLGNSPYSEMTQKFGSLYRWDSTIFNHVIEKGYRGRYEDTGNVFNFPAYPLASSLVHGATDMSIQDSLIVTSLFFAVLFWSLFWYCLAVQGCLLIDRFLCTLVLFSYPGTFFLVTAYSESMFLFLALAYVWLLIKVNGLATISAFMMGYLLGANRGMGIFLGFVPFIWGLSQHGIRSRFWRFFAVALAPCFGVLSFLIFCEMEFNNWDIYFEYQMGERTLTIVPSRIAEARNFMIRKYILDTMDFSRVISALTFVTVSIGSLLFLSKLTKKRSQGFFWWSGTVLFLSYFIIMSPHGSFSMLRYILSPLSLLLVGGWSLFVDFTNFKWALRACVISVCLMMLIIQCYFIGLFAGWRWVA